MQNEVDSDITVFFIEETIKLFPKLKSCSYDKGFWKPENRKFLNTIIDTVILPKKGKLSQKDKDIEFSYEFKSARKKHSAVESGINALKNHGLDRCPDKGIKAFRRYISLAVLAGNLQILGDMNQKKTLKKRNGLKI